MLRFERMLAYYLLSVLVVDLAHQSHLATTTNVFAQIGPRGQDVDLGSLLRANQAFGIDQGTAKEGNGDDLENAAVVTNGFSVKFEIIGGFHIDLCLLFVLLTERNVNEIRVLVKGISHSLGLKFCQQSRQPFGLFSVVRLNVESKRFVVHIDNHSTHPLEVVNTFFQKVFY